MSTNAKLSHARSVAVLCIKFLVAAVFLLAGGLKIYGLPRLVVEFQHIGLGDWFRYATGLLEIVGAIALLIRGFTAAGAAMLACIMVGASVVHLFVFGDSPIAAVVLLGLTLMILFTHLDDPLVLRTRLWASKATSIC